MGPTNTFVGQRRRVGIFQTTTYFPIPRTAQEGWQRVGFCSRYFEVFHDFRFVFMFPGEGEDTNVRILPKLMTRPHHLRSVTTSQRFMDSWNKLKDSLALKRRRSRRLQWLSLLLPSFRSLLLSPLPPPAGPPRGGPRRMHIQSGVGSGNSSTASDKFGGKFWVARSGILSRSLKQRKLCDSKA
jgi:hypothetical protein